MSTARTLRQMPTERDVFEHIKTGIAANENLGLDPLKDRLLFDLYQHVYRTRQADLFAGKITDEIWTIQEYATWNGLNEII